MWVLTIFRPTLLGVVTMLLQFEAEAATATASYLFTQESSAQSGCEQAEKRLKLEQIERQCGAQLSGGKLRVQSERQDRLDHLYFESTAGYVTQYHSLKQQLEMVEPLPGESLFRCVVEAELEGQCNQGRRDPQFAPLFEQQVSLNQLYYKTGEEMVVELRPQQRMTITILQLIPHLESEPRVWRLFPNAYRTEGHLQAGVSISIPHPTEDRYQFIAQLPSGEQRVTEELVVVATREEVQFPEQMSVEQFHRLLAEIPLKDRRELFIPYEIIDTERTGEVQ